MGKKSIDEWFAVQSGVAAVWQLRDDGHTRSTIRHAVRNYREVFSGVYVSGHGELTDLQRWKAATITAPDSSLAEWSAATLLGLHDGELGATCVVRPGPGSRTLLPSSGNRLPLLVIRSTVLPKDVVEHRGIQTLAAPRIVLDLVARTSAERGQRMVRDALRLKVASAVDLRAVAAAHRGRRGAAVLKASVNEYAPLPLDRTQSDAEVLGLAFLAAAGVLMPLANAYVLGEEADFWFPQFNWITELDGPSYHQFAAHDAKKQAKWEAAGITVRRVPTDDVYDNPHRLLESIPPQARLGVAPTTTDDVSAPPAPRSTKSGRPSDHR